MKIVNYRPKYIEQVMELNKSLILEWYSMLGQTKKRSKWLEINSKSRFLHGGPWYDMETLEIHLQSFLKFGKITLLLDDSDEVYGMEEYHETPHEIHLDWILIHPSLQSLGYGTKLLAYLENQGTKTHKARIRTEPEPGVERFYTQNGYSTDGAYFRYEINSKNQSLLNYEEVSVKDLSFKNRFGESHYSDKYLKHLLTTSIQYNELFDDDYPLFKLSLEDFDLVNRKIPALPQIVSSFLVNCEVDYHIKEIPAYINSNVYFTYSSKLNYSWKLTKIIDNMIKKW